MEKGVDIVRFVDISSLPQTQTQGFTKAIVFCLALSKEFIIAIRDGKETGHDEFVEKEHEADALADWLAEYLQRKGYRSYSQSEQSNSQTGNYDYLTSTSRLPHKTIARLAGIGFIGKNNLLINKNFGCAFSMCTVLTDAPVTAESYSLVSSACGGCEICKDVCPNGAILGNEWSEYTGREGVIDVSKCRCPLKCMVHCPQTLNYATQPNHTEQNRFRLDHELPLCVSEWGWKYHHTGIPTTEAMENEQYIAFAKVYVSGFSSNPFGIEWMRWEEDSDYNELIKTVPHLAFVVDNLNFELKRHEFNIIVPPNSPSGGVRVAMIEHNGAPIELMEFPDKYND